MDKRAFQLGDEVIVLRSGPCSCNGCDREVTEGEVHRIVGLGLVDEPQLDRGGAFVHEDNLGLVLPVIP